MYGSSGEIDFELAIEDALDSLLADLRERRDRGRGGEPPAGRQPVGALPRVSFDQGAVSAYAGVAPDKITIYRRPLERLWSADPTRLRREIRRVVLHEAAHHFGSSDERLIEIDRY